MNIGNPNELSILELAQTIRGIIGGKSEIVFVPRPIDDPTIRKPDIELARTSLGWEPTVDLLTGLERTIDWFRTHPDVVG
jgi:dTDP-glucose 4,6-dehydratase